MQIYSHPYRRTTSRLSVTLAQESDGYLLTVETLKDSPGTLYRLCAVLFRHSWDIEQADICTLENNQVVDRFFVRPAPTDGIDEIKFEVMMKDFERLLFENLNISQYIKDRHPPLPNSDTTAAVETAVVEFSADDGRLHLSLAGRDRPGLLLLVAEVFARHEVDILEARIETASGQTIRNRFLINPTDARFNDPKFRERLNAELRSKLMT